VDRDNIAFHTLSPYWSQKISHSNSDVYSGFMKSSFN
jgi:hypothetical protein